MDMTNITNGMRTVLPLKYCGCCTTILYIDNLGMSRKKLSSLHSLRSVGMTGAVGDGENWDNFQFSILNSQFPIRDWLFAVYIIYLRFFV